MLTLTERRASGYTCIALANLRGSDSPSEPTPVHLACWEERGVRGEYQRVKGATRFVVNGVWVGPDAPRDATCWFCREAL